MSITSFRPSTKKPFKTYRSYKQLNEEKFLQDLEQANLTTLIENEDNVNEAYNTFHTKLMGIVDNHMPMKKRKTVHFHKQTTKKSNIQKTNVMQQIFTFKIKEKLGNISPTKNYLTAGL
jgi:hypothetical protein